MWEALIVPAGHYSSAADVITKINEVASANDRFKDEVQLSLDTLNRKVTVHFQNKAEVYFSDNGQMLGFLPKEVISKTSTAERGADLDHGFHHLYVYCDIIQPQYVGDATCSPTSNRTRRRKGWSGNQQVIYSPAIRTCQQKAVRKYRSQYKAGHRRNRAIRVWESLAYTSFSTEQTSELLKRRRKFTRAVLLRSSQAKGWEFTSFSRCSISARLWISRLWQKRYKKESTTKKKTVRLQARNAKHLRSKRNPKTNFLLDVKMAFVHHESQECTKSELDLFTIPATLTNVYHQGAMD